MSYDQKTGHFLIIARRNRTFSTSRLRTDVGIAVSLFIIRRRLHEAGYRVRRRF